MTLGFLLASAGALAAAFAVFVLSFVSGTAPRAEVERTLATVDRTYQLVGEADEPAPFSERVVTPLARRIGELVRVLTPTAAVARLERHLDLAGKPRDWPMSRVMQAKGTATVVVAALGAAIGALYGGPGMSLLGALGGAVAGFFVPDLLVYNLGIRRQQEIRRTLPDILDVLTICVEAGLGFDAALAQVAQNGRGPMAGETSRLLQEMRIGMSRTDAMRTLAQRTTIQELRTFASAIVQASELGIPIANVLREQAKEMRLRRRQRAEEQAQKVPIKILFPMLFCMFPSLFVVVIGPGVINMIRMFSA
ncbi:MAG TPA: type II secretion system F family protein [Micromonosporaceae bacterium]|jgi:tight adherence protein C|nr:type II secretion system F family protein [Micromonosporaceae bacterium]